MKTFVIVVQALILFVVGVIVALLVGLLAGIAGAQWLDKKAQADAEVEEEKEWSEVHTQRERGDEPISGETLA